MQEKTLLSVLGTIWDKILHGVNWQLLYKETPHLLGGAAYAVLITAVAVLVGVTLGMVLAFMRQSRRFYFRWPATVYLEVFRCTPLILQILLFYYAIFPGLQEFNAVLGLFPDFNFTKVSAFYPGTLALGLNSAAYLGEAFRGGIQSIDKGQREAALSLGMYEYQAMYHVVLPQALLNALPAIGNEFVTLIKDSALLSVISFGELLYRANQVGARRFEYFTMLIGAGIIYFLMCFPTSRALAHLEKKMRVGKK